MLIGLELKKGARKGWGRDRGGYSLKRMFLVDLTRVFAGGGGSLSLASALRADINFEKFKLDNTHAFVITHVMQ